MKTTILKFTTTGLVKSFIPALLAGMLTFQNAMAMPANSGENPIEISSTGKVKALSYFKHNTLKIMLHVENPDLERMEVQIYNSRQGVIHKEYISKRDVIVAKYNLESVPDGDYTIQVKSATFSYSKSFSIKTSVSREVKMQKQDFQAEQQEAI